LRGLCRFCGALCAALFAAVPAAVESAEPVAAKAPGFQLAKPFRPGVQLSQYRVSEKLDGVRALWDGEKLVSRGGRRFAAPDWFTRGFPAQPLDGELWAGRGGFERTASIVARKAPHPGWRELRFMAFDLPDPSQPFDERLAALQRVVEASDAKHLDWVRRRQFADNAALMKWLDEVVAAGGEGLMLQRGDAGYRSGRSDALLKLKKFDDAEARVIAHHPGRGRLAGMLGAIEVETPAGLRFRIGSGFSDAERRAPPPIGSTITYRHHGLTGNGIPRFPTFWRIRKDEPPQPPD